MARTATAGRDGKQAEAYPVPPGRVIELPGRGMTFMREVPGTPGAPTLLLLHGLTASADLNWGPSYAALGRHFRVVALDQRGHGRGIAPELPFRLETCADDAAALVEVLGIRSVIAVGYSMGGMVAQLLWRRHPHLVGGLVLCSTACDFRISSLEHLAVMSTLSVVACARLVPPLFRIGVELVGSLLLGPLDDVSRHWVSSHLAETDLAVTLSAAQAVSRFVATDWIGEVDVPTGVLVTTQDRVVPPVRQLELACSISGAETHVIEDGHGVCLNGPDRFVPVLLAACRSVAARPPAAVPV